MKLFCLSFRNEKILESFAKPPLSRISHRLCVLSHVCLVRSVWLDWLWPNPFWMQLGVNWRRRPNLFTESDLAAQLVPELTHRHKARPRPSQFSTQPRLSLSWSGSFVAVLSLKVKRDCVKNWQNKE
jgi:hypothetical protein